MNTVERVIAVLDLLASDNVSFGVTEIAKQLRISKSSTYNILSSLENIQWVEQNPKTQRYSLKTKLGELGLSVISRIDLRVVSLPVMQELLSITGETIILSLRVDFERVYIAQVESRLELRQVVELGKRFPLWLGATGKAILAYMDETEIEKVINGLITSQKETLASGQTININKFRGELSDIRKQGFAITMGERSPGVTGVAAPIFNRDEVAMGAITIGGPSQRLNMNLALDHGKLIRGYANTISAQLGSNTKL